MRKSANRMSPRDYTPAFTLTPSVWDALDCLTNAYGIENRA